MKNALKIAAAALCCVALIACSQKGPAEAALKAAETSMNEVKADGAKYAAEQPARQRAPRDHADAVLATCR